MNIILLLLLLKYADNSANLMKGGKPVRRIHAITPAAQISTLAPYLYWTKCNTINYHDTTEPIQDLHIVCQLAESEARAVG